MKTCKTHSSDGTMTDQKTNKSNEKARYLSATYLNIRKSGKNIGNKITKINLLY